MVSSSSIGRSVTFSSIVNADAANPNVSGFAWGENFGWISFNSKDCDPDNDGAFNGLPSGCPLSSPPAVNSYGVSIDSSTGLFSGHAWSENAGWIDFGPTSGFPSAPLHAATYDLSSGEVTGWAKVLALGDDGWLKMSDDTVPSWLGQGLKISSSTYEFSGWAWNGNSDNSGLGWVSFNSSDAGAGGGPYKVVASSLGSIPTVNAASMMAPQWSSSTAAVSGALMAKLTFSYNDSLGNGGKAYRIVIKDALTNATTTDTGKCENGSSSNLCYDFSGCLQSAPSFTCSYIVDNNRLGFNGIDYNKSYYWYVQVWNQADVASTLTQYNNNSIADTDHDIDADSRTFTTYTHEFPVVSFSYSPTRVTVGQVVNFTNQSTTTLPYSPLVSDWTFVNGLPGTSTSTDPISKFDIRGTSLVTLVVTDNNGYQSSSSTSISVDNRLPSWQEVKPQ
ncbi:MAG: hypothetical protein US81_C0024G0007 [Parcubacteria group bacterium GW2011_GWE2_38_18]|nr:MAG: hypothetical protein US81_C0024G0007 [Parcubacteria group bacterium GW2011_GWE2_38_18]